MLTAEARARESAWALARRARAWTLAYNGMAMAARMPMMATTIINSMSVKPRWLPSTLRFQNLCICLLLETATYRRSSASEGEACIPGARSVDAQDLAGRWQVTHFRAQPGLWECA